MRIQINIRSRQAVAVIAILLILAPLAWADDLATEGVPPKIAEQSQTAETPASESIQRTKRALAGDATPSQSGAGAKALTGILFSFAVLGGLAAIAKKYQQKHGRLGGGVDIELLAKRQLTPKHALFVVDIEGQRLVLGASGERLQLLTTLDSFSDELDDSLRFSELGGETLAMAQRSAPPKAAVG